MCFMLNYKKNKKINWKEEQVAYKFLNILIFLGFFVAVTINHIYHRNSFQTYTCPNVINFCPFEIRVPDFCSEKKQINKSVVEKK